MDSTGISNWILGNIVPIMLAVIGILIIARSKKGDWSGTLNTSGIVIVGLMFLVGAGAFIAFSREMSGVVFGG